jgi:excisionase family DNA binding protein
MQTKQQDDLMTLREVAERLRCSKSQVGRLVAGHVCGCAPLPSIPLGRRKLVRRASLETWIEENERTAGGDRISISPVRGVGPSRIERKHA